MFLLWGGLALVVLGIILLGIGGICSSDGLFGTGMCSLVFGIIFAFIAFFATGCAVYNHRVDKRELVRLDNVEAIYANKAEALTAKFSARVDQYIKHEKDVFGSISPAEIDIYLVKYPELRSIEAITVLVAEIKQLETDRYDQQIAKIKIVKTMECRLVNPWILSSFVDDK